MTVLGLEMKVNSSVTVEIEIGKYDTLFGSDNEAPS